MNRDETARLLGMLQIHYDQAFKNFDDEMLKLAISTWHSGLQDLEASLVFNVAQKIVNTDLNPYPPKLAYIRQECLKIMNPTSLISPETAYETARKAIKSFGRYNEGKGLESLSSPIRRAVNAIGWQRWCNATDEEMGFIKRDFMEFYNDFDTPEREQKMLPPQTLQRLQELQKKAEQKRLGDGE